MTEQEIIKKFGELGFECKKYSDYNLVDFLSFIQMSVIRINTKNKIYIKVNCVDYSDFVPIFLKEHQLLTELFKCWEWI